VPNESHVPNLLKAHHAYQRSRLFVAPEHNTLIDFILQFLAGHVRFCPAILRDDPFKSERAIVDDGTNQLEVMIVTAADHEYSAS
jgi:hypothetical protein